MSQTALRICFECMARFGVAGVFSPDLTDSARFCPFCGENLSEKADEIDDGV